MTVPRTICLGFLAVIATGSLLLLLPISKTAGGWDHPITALFTATSAVCVTGLSVVDVGTYYSGVGQAIIAILVQVGGLGYMTATTFLLVLLGREFRLKDKLALHQTLETPGISGIRQMVISIISVTLICEILGIFLLLPVFSQEFGLDRGLWFAIFHSISAFNNAGFGLLPDSFMRYVSNPVLNLTVSALIIVGGLGYQVIMELYLWFQNEFKGHPRRILFSMHFKVVTSTTIALLAVGTIAFLATEFNNPDTLGPLSFPGKLLASWFQSVTVRTAGFNSLNLGAMTTTSLFMTIAFMFVGASPGGTGGGVKTTTLRVLMACTRATLQGKTEVLCYQRKIPTDVILKSISMVLGSVVIVVSSTILISLVQPQVEFLPLFYETVSAFATVGLSIGVTAQASIGTQLILIVVMYVGRVGVLMLMSALLGGTAPSIVHYPEEELLVG
ncbi:MAG: TrkH family potassium uptake protein [Prochlorotrichaceae cyanobacterium]